jgi:hypothetical protein
MSFFKRLVPLKADIRLELEKPVVENGQPFKGTATLDAKEAFKVEQVRIEVKVKESYTEPQWERDPSGNQRQKMVKKVDVRFSQDVSVSQAFDIAKGDQKRIPLEATVPMFQPSRFGGAILYSLKAVAAVKGRPDVTAEVTPSVTPSTVVTQVIQKEIVKVPCKYCGTLVELTSGVNKCPNCGSHIGM